MIFSADFKQCGIKHTIYKHLTGAHTGAPLQGLNYILFGKTNHVMVLYCCPQNDVLLRDFALKRF